MTKTDERIMVATQSVDDGDLVAELLRAEFDNVVVSSDPDHCVDIFDKDRPAVLVLAYKGLEKSQQQYLGLYRRSKAVHLPHKTVVLCSYDESPKAYELCKKRYFDDYVPFWPMTNDTSRLLMAVHHALWQLSESLIGTSTARELLAQAQEFFEMEHLLENYAAKGGQHIEAANELLLRGETNIDAALRPLREWTASLKEALASQLSAASSLRVLSAGLKPIVLIVDDDEFQIQLLTRVLSDAGIELNQAGSGAAALASLGKIRPDLIVMDIQLPDIDGIEVTRRLKSMDRFATIPVIMITGQSEKNVVIESLRAGASDFVVKPFDKDVLLEKMLRFLNGPARAQAGQAL